MITQRNWPSTKSAGKKVYIEDRFETNYKAFQDFLLQYNWTSVNNLEYNKLRPTDSTGYNILEYFQDLFFIHSSMTSDSVVELRVILKKRLDYGWTFDIDDPNYWTWRHGFNVDFKIDGTLISEVSYKGGKHIILSNLPSGSDFIDYISELNEDEFNNLNFGEFKQPPYTDDTPLLVNQNIRSPFQKQFETLIGYYVSEDRTYSIGLIAKSSSEKYFNFVFCVYVIKNDEWWKEKFNLDTYFQKCEITYHVISVVKRLNNFDNVKTITKNTDNELIEPLNWNTQVLIEKKLSDDSTIDLRTAPFEVSGNFNIPVQGPSVISSFSEIQDPNYLKSLPIPNKEIDFQKAKYVKKFFNHTFVWGFENHENIIYYSNGDNYCYFPENNNIKISKNPDEIIQDIVFFQNSVLIVFTNFNIYMLKQVLNSNKIPIGYQAVQINAGIGTPFRRSVKTIGAHVYFVGSDFRIYILKSLYNTTIEEKFNLATVDEKITNILKPLLEKKLKDNPDRLFTLNVDLQYHLFIDKWRFKYYTDSQLHCWTFDESELFKEVLGGDYSDGELRLFTFDKVFKEVEDEPTDNNQPIELVLITPRYDFGRPHHKKSFKKVFFQFGEMNAKHPLSLGLLVKVDDQLIDTMIEPFAIDGFDQAYSLQNVLKDNFYLNDFSGTAEQEFKIGDPWYPIGDLELDHFSDLKLSPKEIGQQRVYASGKGMTWQVQLIYNKPTIFKLKSLAVELRVKSAK